MDRAREVYQQASFTTTQPIPLAFLTEVNTLQYAINTTSPTSLVLKVVRKSTLSNRTIPTNPLLRKQSLIIHLRRSGSGNSFPITEIIENKKEYVG